jgi:DNA-binding NtrC family response regulator
VTDARKLLGEGAIGCALLDIRLRDGDGLALLRELREGPRRNVPIIMMTAYGDSERTIQAMRDGAFDYVTKPFDLDRLLAVVDRALEQFQLAREPLPQTASAAVGALVGSSEAMLAVTKVIGRAAASDAPVLITGETGTGKELVARAIHRYSSRAEEPFVAVNLAALAPTLLESELFGHEKGAFTGAAARRLGRIEAAGAGTLLLDEVADLEPSLQTKLLRVLQEGAFERVGGNEPITSRARIVLRRRPNADPIPT